MQNFETVKLLWEVAEKYKPSKDVYPSGFYEFDRVMDGGLRDGELVVISGPTASGKTTFAQLLSKNMDRVGVPSLWFSYECNPWYLREKFKGMGCDSGLLAYSPTDLISNSIGFIKAEIQEAVLSHGCKVVFLDHLHYLIPLEQSRNSSLLIGGVVRSIKRMAIETGVIICLIAHTKKIYQDEELDLSSIRDSSLIAQEADYVFLIERIKKKKKMLEAILGSEWTNFTKISLAKNRRTGIMIFMKFSFKDNQLFPITEKYEEQ